MEPSDGGDGGINRVEMKSKHRRVKMVDEEETHVEHAWSMNPQDRRFRPAVYASRGRVSTSEGDATKRRPPLGARACGSRS